MNPAAYIARTVVLLTITLSLLGIAAAHAQESTGGLLDTTQCRLQYDEGMDEAASSIMNAITTEYDLLSQQLGIRPETRIEAHLFRGMGTFTSEAGRGASLRPAVYTNGVLLIRPPRGISEEKMQFGLSYELAMIFLSRPIEHSCPPWLAQAFAVYHAGISPDCWAPSAAALGSFADLSQAMQQARLAADRADADCLLAKTMQFFVDRYGQEKAFSIFKEFDGKMTAEEVFEKAYGERFANIEKAWVRTVAQSSERAKRH